VAVYKYWDEATQEWKYASSGMQGTQGYTGSRGYTGSMGALGYTGSQGLIGVTGAASSGGATNGGAGSDGVVIIRYPTADWGICTGGTKTTDGTDTIHTFTSSGTFTAVAP